MVPSYHLFDKNNLQVSDNSIITTKGQHTDWKKKLNTKIN